MVSLSNVLITRTPPVEAHRPVVTYLQFPIQVCFSIRSVCRPRPAKHAHFRRRHPCGLNSSIDFYVNQTWTCRLRMMQKQLKQASAANKTTGQAAKLSRIRMKAKTTDNHQSKRNAPPLRRAAILQPQTRPLSSINETEQRAKHKRRPDDSTIATCYKIRAFSSADGTTTSTACASSA